MRKRVIDKPTSMGQHTKDATPPAVSPTPALCKTFISDGFTNLQTTWSCTRIRQRKKRPTCYGGGEIKHRDAGKKENGDANTWRSEYLPSAPKLARRLSNGYLTISRCPIGLQKLVLPCGHRIVVDDPLPLSTSLKLQKICAQDTPREGFQLIP